MWLLCLLFFVTALARPDFLASTATLSRVLDRQQPAQQQLAMTDTPCKPDNGVDNEAGCSLRDALKANPTLAGLALTLDQELDKRVWGDAQDVHAAMWDALRANTSLVGLF